ncbi:MAG: thiol peroxidase [Bdellovibrionaceae bacterium]|nr:thiol peroxidase [Pseudobdellovibrionaceae bacterium]
MATITLKGNPIQTSGQLPAKGTTAPDFKLLRVDLSEVSLANFGNKKKVLNIFPSVDTATCAMSVRTFNKEAAALGNVAVLNISADLPFAQKRFCGAEGITNAEALSTFRSDFAKTYGLQIMEGPLAGLCSRVVIVLDENNKVVYSEQVSEVANEPNYTAALASLSGK